MIKIKVESYFPPKMIFDQRPFELNHYERGCPAKNTAAIVVSRRCFIESYLGRGTDGGVGI